MFTKPNETARAFVLACLPSHLVHVAPAPNGDPLVASAIAMRTYLAATIENLVDLLDELDGDPDLDCDLSDYETGDDDEPSIGWTMYEAARGWPVQHAMNVDLEEDAGDEREINDDGWGAI